MGSYKKKERKKTKTNKNNCFGRQSQILVHLLVLHRGPKSNCAIVDENEPSLLQEKEKSLVLKSGLQLCPFDRRLLDRLDLSFIRSI